MRQPWARITSVVALLLAWAACASSQAGTDEIAYLPDDPYRGWAVFTEKGCINCHMIRGEGGKVGPDLGRKVFNLSLLQIAGVMWNHAPMMNLRMKELNLERPALQGAEMGDLIAFLYYLNYFDEPGDPDRGRELFSDKSCVLCHAIEGKGGDRGPALDRMKEHPSPVFIAQSMWNHGPRMTDAMRKPKVATPRFEGREIVDLFAYIRSTSVTGGGWRVHASPGNARRGQELFVSKGCAQCHAAGDGPGPDLSRMESQYSVTQIAGLMWNHRLQMRERMTQMGIPDPVLSGEEMADIIAYVYSIRYSGEAGDPSKGGVLFTSKGCIVCHRADDQGEAVGPDLAALRIARPPIAAAQAMWNHAPFMETRMKERDMTWPRFTGNEMADLIAFLGAPDRPSPGDR